MSVLLNGIQWETYEKLVCDLESQNGPRLAYDHGTLEIMSPLPRHENRKETLTLLVNMIAAERNWDIQAFGSTTFRRESAQRGAEPVSCFYIQSVDQLPENLDDADLDTLPPPDLVIEIDQTSPSLDTLPIYASLGVPEIWRDNGRQAFILRRNGEGYDEVLESGVLPGVTSSDLSEFLTLSRTMRRTAWLHRLRAWARGEEPETDA
jgi:Uma2 family endonuclease